MSASVKVKTRMNAGAIKKKMDREGFKNLKHAGGAIRKTAVRSVRKRKKSSSPGSPPHTRTGHLKRVIAYVATEHEVDIGPTNEFSQSIWPLHEFGGETREGHRKTLSKRYGIGDRGPIGQGKARGRDRRKRATTTARVVLKTDKQVERANRLQQELDQSNDARRNARRKYPKRPFMGPALALLREQLPQYWKGALNR